MQDEQYLLRRQKIEGNDIIEDDVLEELYQSKANKKFPLIPFAPYVWIHHLGEKSYDTVKIENKIAKIDVKYELKKVNTKVKKKNWRDWIEPKTGKSKRKNGIWRRGIS